MRTLSELMHKLKTTQRYASTGIQLGDNWRSQFLLASMLPRLKLQQILGLNTSRVYTAEVAIGDLKQSLHFRAQDIFIFHEVLGYSPYIIPDFYKSRPCCIIDLGAHIGLATLQFRSAFPRAVLHCYEPDPENFLLLKLNTSLAPNIFHHYEAVGPDLDKTILYVHQNRHSSTSLKRPYDFTDVCEVKCIVKPLDTIISEVDHIVDLIKFDIEWIEYQAFSQSNLVHQVRFLVGEMKASPSDVDRFVSLFPYHHALVQRVDKNMHFIHLRRTLAS
jgi:FkbM family methyltransferase